MKTSHPFGLVVGDLAGIEAHFSDLLNGAGVVLGIDSVGEKELCSASGCIHFGWRFVRTTVDSHSFLFHKYLTATTRTLAKPEGYPR